MDQAWFYILASQRNGTLYCGSTNELARRIWEHKTDVFPGFTSRYGVKTLVYYEGFNLLMEARAREYAVKSWRRAWKLQVIEAMNPEWIDLYYDLNR